MADIVMEMKKKRGGRRLIGSPPSSPFQICISQSVSPAAKPNGIRATFFTLCYVPIAESEVSIENDGSFLQWERDSQIGWKLPVPLD